jgi:hypothetical protein
LERALSAAPGAEARKGEAGEAAELLPPKGEAGFGGAAAAAGGAVAVAVVVAAAGADADADAVAASSAPNSVSNLSRMSPSLPRNCLRSRLMRRLTCAAFSLNGSKARAAVFVGWFLGVWRRRR